MTTGFRPLLVELNKRRDASRKLHTIEQFRFGDSRTTKPDLHAVIMFVGGASVTKRNNEGKVTAWSGPNNLPAPTDSKVCLDEYARPFLPEQCSRGRQISTPRP